MRAPLLVTKTYLPHPPARLVPRPVLFARLQAGLASSLTLVSAPAGFGKTTLLSAWLDHLSRQEAGLAGWDVAWLSLDAHDNDPIQFWSYVIAALQTAAPGLAETARAAALGPSPPPLAALTSALINAVSAVDRRLVLTLDDYHAIRSETVHASLNELLDRLPSNLRVIVATREDPPLALARRRARGELAEIRAGDLRFSAGETAELLNGCLALDLPPGAVAALHQRTEGWPVGLRLAALSLQERRPPEREAFVQSFTGDDRFIFDYLMDEVFHHLPPRQQTFLLRTCLLERLCDPLCRAVTGLEDSPALLQALERANLFVQPLDNRRQWYRYHPLFADLLQQRLMETESAETVAALREKASAWHEQAGLLPEAVAYALALPDPEYAAALLERRVLDSFYRSEISLVYRWLSALPETTLRRHPLLGAVYANTLALIFGTPEALARAARWLDRAEADLEMQPVYAGQAEARGFMAKFRAYLARMRGEPPREVIRLASLALEQLPGDMVRFRGALAFLLGRVYADLGDESEAVRAFTDARRHGEASGDWFNALAAVNMLASFASQRGALREAVRLCREALAALAQQPDLARHPPPVAGAVSVSLGSLLVETNALEEAGQHLQNGLALLELTTFPESQAAGWVALARLRCSRDDGPGALVALGQAEPYWAQKPELLAAWKARIWLALAGRDPSSAAAADGWASTRRLPEGLAEPAGLEEITLARWLVLRGAARAAQGHPSRPGLAAFLAGQLDAARRCGRAALALEVLILQALAFQLDRRMDSALASLSQALALAEPEGYVRLFLEPGPAIAPLLRLAAGRGPARAYVACLLEALAVEGEGAPPAPAQSLPEALSARELEVLRLLAEGLSNRQIAARLHLSANTVRIHASRIYAKLGTGSRAQAAARARALGLL
jgi:LuxR family maltose regulon positive regulatory protein